MKGYTELEKKGRWKRERERGDEETGKEAEKEKKKKKKKRLWYGDEKESKSFKTRFCKPKT